MKDYSELKKLAEEFPEDLDFDSNNEPFFNGPSGESLGGGSTGFYSVYGKPFLIDGDDYEYDGPTYVEACNLEFAKFMIASRDGVLELIAEVEGLRKGRTDWQAECLKRGFEYVRESDDHYVLADIPEMAELLGLLLGVEVRSKDNDSYGETVSMLQDMADANSDAFHRAYELEKENESLKKDAARYRWLRDNKFDVGSYHPEHDHNHQSWFEHFDDETIDENLLAQSK